MRPSHTASASKLVSFGGTASRVTTLEESKGSELIGGDGVRRWTVEKSRSETGYDRDDGELEDEVVLPSSLWNHGENKQSEIILSN
jgi:hypothetical protein